MTGATVDVYRNGLFLKNTANTGGYTYSTTFTGQASYRFKVCEVGSSSLLQRCRCEIQWLDFAPHPAERRWLDRADQEADGLDMDGGERDYGRPLSQRPLPQKYGQHREAH